ncbi:uncharacterized protein LOC144746997 isoform X2 [Ciona intestinalis]
MNETHDTSAIYHGHYGSVFTPVVKGSGGAGGYPGSGGGALHMKVGRTLHLDGLLSSKGSDATGEKSSGGSGGSILIETTNFTGHGELSVRGGDGRGGINSNDGTSVLGGGGGGGRVGMHVRHQNNYGGLYTTEGGVGMYGTTASPVHLPVDGSAGTIYKYESRRGPQYRELKYNTTVDEANYKPDHTFLKIDAGSRRGFNTDAEVSSLPTMIMEEGTIDYEFDEIQLHGTVNLLFYHPRNNSTVSAIAHELTGDKQGIIAIRDQQILYVHYVESTHILSWMLLQVLM